MASLAAIVFHWVSAALTLPFAVATLFASNPEKVKFAEDKVALPLPAKVLGFCSNFAHLTIVGHELVSGYFVWALLRDHQILFAADPDGTEDLGAHAIEVYFAVAVTVALFVAIVFWTAALIDPALMAPIDLIFPQHLKLAPAFKRHLLFQAMFGPSEPIPDCAWQAPFRWFMRYVHTLCPLLVVLDPLFVTHQPGTASMELLAAVTFAFAYLAWNFFCWWLLRSAPYPLQKRFYLLGIFEATCCYMALIAFVGLLWLYSRWMRSADAPSFVILAVVCVLWATSCLFPLQGWVAKQQGLDPRLIANGWVSGSQDTFISEAARQAYMEQRERSAG